MVCDGIGHRRQKIFPVYVYIVFQREILPNLIKRFVREERQQSPNFIKSLKKKM